MFADHHTRYFIGWWPTPNFIGFNQLDANGVTTYPSVALNSVTMVAPAWDADMYYQCTYNGTLCLRQFSISALTATLTAERAANADPGWGLARGAPFQGEVDASGTQSWWPATNWVRSDINVSAVAAAPNGVVALYAKSATSGRIPVPEAVPWYLGVLNRSTGATLWEVQLPTVGTNIAGEPLWEGVAVDRNGYIIVALRNGNILCYGNGVVSVARRDVATMPAATAAVRPSTASWSPAPSQEQPAPLTPAVQPVAPAPENDPAAIAAQPPFVRGEAVRCMLTGAARANPAALTVSGRTRAPSARRP